jgi:hypothetical protein
MHNRRASSVTSGFHALLGTSRNPDEAVNLGAMSAVYQVQSRLLNEHHNRAFSGGVTRPKVAVIKY